MSIRLIKRIALLLSEILLQLLKVFVFLTITILTIGILKQFHWFSDSAWWTAIGTIAVAIIALWPKLRIFFFGTKVQVSLAEKIALVISSNLKINKVQIGINLVNESIKDLLVNRMIITIRKETEPKTKYVLDWNLFIEDFKGSGTAPKERPHPFVLKAEDSHYEMVQFYSESGPLHFEPGKYKLFTDVWVNQKYISEPPRYVQDYTFEVTTEDIGNISIEKNEIESKKEPATRLVHIPLSDWNFTKRF